jgi:hypothetical protein
LFPGSRREFGKLSTTLSLLRRSVVRANWLLWFLVASVWSQAAPWGPSPEIRSQLEKITVVVSGPSDLDRVLAPLVALRQRYPNDLWVNERYQDVVQQYGIEGHLRQLTEDYQVLSMQHPDDAMYSYLYARSLMGRNTPAAAQQMTEIVAAHPDFAPAHGALAEIYASATFHDESREKAERERFLALCPDSMLQRSEVRRRPAGYPVRVFLLIRRKACWSRVATPTA